MALCDQLNTILLNSGCAQCCCKGTYTETGEEVVINANVIGNNLLSLFAYVPSLGKSLVYDEQETSCDNNLPFEVTGPINCVSC